MLLLENKIALVTGGSRGIGQAIVRQFVLQGARVVFTYFQSHEAASALVQELGADKVHALACDGKNAQEVQEAVKQAQSIWGRIDILVNNSGVTRDNILLRMSEEEWDEVMDTNLKSVFLFSKNACKYMLRTGGSIINISSIMGITGNVGQANYAASKAGIIALTKTIAQEYGSRNIRCNAIAPGWIQTDMTNRLDVSIQAEFEKQVCLQRVGTPDDVAQVAVFLASEMSSYITAEVIQVTGGIKR